nr:hypothetical protein B0A51_05070 [Rachicladosporium sp. CCFEE 5018]
MAPLEPPSEIILRVKVPPGHLEGDRDEFSVGAIYTSLTVGAVRQRIQQLLPSNPVPERQRILYGGRALVDNEQSLADALNTRRDTSQTEYVIHLLVKDQATDNNSPHRRMVSTPAPVNAAAGHHGPHDAPGAPHQPAGAPLNGPMHQHMHHAQHLAMLQQRQAAMQQQAQLQHHLMMQQHQMMQHRPGAPGAPFGMPPAQMGAPGEGVPPPALNVDTLDRQQQNVDGASNEPQQGDPAAQNPNPAAMPNPGRPVSGQGFHVQGVGPDGNRFEIHQQTMNIPGNVFPGRMPVSIPMPQFPGLGMPFPMPGMTSRPQAPSMPASGAPSALDRARHNVTEMRLLLDQMRAANANEAELARVAQLEQHMNAVNDYIDPFRVGRVPPLSQAPPPAPTPTSETNGRVNGMPTGGPPLPNLVHLHNGFPAPHGMQGQASPFRRVQMPIPTGFRPNLPAPQSQTPSDVSCYLLSSPTGPQALLFSPEHGQFTGRLNNTSAQRRFRRAPSLVPTHTAATSQPGATPTQPVPAPGEQAVAQQNAAAPPPDPAVAQIQQGGAPDPLAPIQPLINNFWMLFRVMIFAYFLMGANMGWRRPVALGLIGLGFWMIRAGLFGDNGIMRRWWEGVVRVDQAAPRVNENAVAAGDNAQQAQPAAVPTPEQLAQRLLQQRQDQLNRAPLHRLREQVRPLERAAALFFASLWPGIGEAHVQAQEAEERRRNEEEVEARRREEEARSQAEQSGEKSETGSGEKSTIETIEDHADGAESMTESSALPSAAATEQT